MKNWEKSWSKYEETRKAGVFFMNNAHNIVFNILGKKYLKNKKIIDIGCGTGNTMLKFKQHGFKKIIGLDHSESSIEICKSRGLEKNKDVFLGDAFKLPFKEQQFELVFSEGLLEHFVDFKMIVREMCRVSKKYVLLIQPNHFSVFKILANFYYKIFPNPLVVKEYTYRLEEFNKEFLRCGFQNEITRTSLLGAFWIILYKKVK